MSVQANGNDKILLGHGSYEGGVSPFSLPAGFELIILQPVGYTLTVGVAERLISQAPIDKVVLRHASGGAPSDWAVPAAIYRGGDNVPDLVLYDLAGTPVQGSNAANVVRVNMDTPLSQLVRTLSPGRLFWCACASQVSGNGAYLS